MRRDSEKKNYVKYMKKLQRRRCYICLIIGLVVGLVLGVLAGVTLCKETDIFGTFTVSSSKRADTEIAVPDKVVSADELNVIGIGEKTDNTEDDITENTETEAQPDNAEITAEPEMIIPDENTETPTEPEETVIPEETSIEQASVENDVQVEPTEESTEEPTAEPTEESTEEPTAETTEEPTPEPTVEPTPVPEVDPANVMPSEEISLARGADAPVNVDEWYTLEADGVKLAVRVRAYISPETIGQKYGNEYTLYGNEACVAVEICNMSGADIDPESVLDIRFADDNDEIYQGYPLMDAPFAGTTGNVIADGETAQLYKRFIYVEGIGLRSYIIVDYALDGITQRTYFDLTGLE